VDDQSAFLTAALLTLMGAAWLMSRIPSCDHETCRAYCKEEAAKELRAARHGEIERLHSFHDRFRPQSHCPLCAADVSDDAPDDEA